MPRCTASLSFGCMPLAQIQARTIRIIALVLVFLICPWVAPSTSHAEPTRIAIYGDSFATGIYFGMRDVLPQSRDIAISRRSRGGTGLVRNDAYSWVRQLGAFIHIDRPNIVIVSLGGNDRQDFRFEDLAVERFSDLWWREYVRRAERVMLDLRAGDSSVYWVGIPIVRSQRMMRDFRKLNSLFRELTRQYGIHYIDLETQFRGPNRGYTPFDAQAGTRERIRHRDGIHFTSLGNYRFAQLIANAIRKRLAAAP